MEFRYAVCGLKMLHWITDANNMRYVDRMYRRTDKINAPDVVGTFVATKQRKCRQYYRDDFSYFSWPKIIASGMGQPPYCTGNAMP